MTKKQYNVGYFDEPTDIDDFVECNGEYLSSSEVVDRLNELVIKCNTLAERKEQLKTLLQNTSDQRGAFHRGARENANRVRELEKENEQLKQFRDQVFILINDYIWQWEDEGTPVAQEMRKLKEELKDKYNEPSALYEKLEEQNKQLLDFKYNVFDLLNKTIKEETRIAENIEEIMSETRPYAMAVNRLTIKTLENLKMRLQG